MKRLIAAVSFAVLAVPAVAAESGKPFEQLDLDRALPQINTTEQARQIAASSGSTRSDVEIAVESQEVNVKSTGDAGLATGPWANDHNFIAPAQ